MPRLSIVALRVLGSFRASYPASVETHAALHGEEVEPIHLPGFFVTIEGIEGAGKTTLVSMLEKRLAQTGAEVIATSEPGGDGVANRIRKLLLDASNEISDRAELLLFEAARAQHVDTKIIPALERGAAVICDRFTDSSVAYQGHARGIEIDTVKTLNDYATRGLRPDLTILLDLPVEAGLARTKGMDRFSSELKDFHEAVRNGFLALAKAEPGRFLVIDATLPPDEMARLAFEAVETGIAAHCRPSDGG